LAVDLVCFLAVIIGRLQNYIVFYLMMTTEICLEHGKGLFAHLRAGKKLQTDGNMVSFHQYFFVAISVLKM
jgi:hypothetical protein